MSKTPNTATTTTHGRLTAMYILQICQISHRGLPDFFVPIFTKKMTADDAKSYCEDILKQLHDQGIRAKYDDRTMYNPGWKYNHYELKGVPIRIEVGPRDMKNSQYVAVRRDNLEKLTMKKDNLRDELPALLETIQSSMFSKASKEMNEKVKVVTNFDDFLQGLDNKCLLQAPFCGAEECEDVIKELSKKDADLEPNAPSMGAKSLCIPFTQPAQISDNDKCIKPGCCEKPQFYTMFGRSY